MSAQHLRQTLGAQLDQLRAAGCTRICREKVLRAQPDRPEVLKPLNTISPSDVGR
jgi:hypothetical protein